jgi:hypothetical protein
MASKKGMAISNPKMPKDNAFRVAAKTVVEVNRKALDSLKNK